MESCPSWPKERDWNSRRPLPWSRGFKSLALRHEIIFLRPVSQAVKTPPFHGGSTGSNPVRVTIKVGGLAQPGEHLPYKQGVAGSSPEIGRHTSELQSRGHLVCR